MSQFVVRCDTLILVSKVRENRDKNVPLFLAFFTLIYGNRCLVKYNCLLFIFVVSYKKDIFIFLFLQFTVQTCIFL